MCVYIYVIFWNPSFTFFIFFPHFSIATTPPSIPHSPSVGHSHSQAPATPASLTLNLSHSVTFTPDCTLLSASGLSCFSTSPSTTLSLSVESPPHLRWHTSPTVTVTQEFLFILYLLSFFGFIFSLIAKNN